MLPMKIKALCFEACASSPSDVIGPVGQLVDAQMKKVALGRQQVKAPSVADTLKPADQKIRAHHRVVHDLVIDEVEQYQQVEIHLNLHEQRLLHELRGPRSEGH